MTELKPSSAIQRAPLNKGGWNAPHALQHDAAIDRYAHWRTFYHDRFRYTRATGKSTIVFLIALPALIGYTAYQSEGLFEFAGKRRGERITTRD